MQFHPSSVAFDEDFEAELSENRDAKIEVSVLAKSPDPELTEVSHTISILRSPSTCMNLSGTKE